MKKTIIILFCLAIASGFFWSSKMFGRDINNDQTTYDQIAQNILYNGSFTFEGRPAFIEPAYPFFLAGVYYIFGHNFNAVRIIQIIIFALSVVVFLKLGLLIFNKNIALAASLFMAIFYGLASPAGIIGPSTLFIFFILLLVYTLYRLEALDKNIYWSLAGIITGLAALIVGSIEFLPLFVVVNLLATSSRIDLRRGLARVGIFSLFFVLTLIPWSLRASTHIDSNLIAPKKGYLLLSKVEIANNVYSNATGHFIGNFLGYYIAEKFYPSVTPDQAREAPKTEARFKKLEAEGVSYYKIDQEFFSEAEAKIIKNPEKFGFEAVLNLITLNSPIIPNRSDWQNEVYIHPMFTGGEYKNIPEVVKLLIVLGIRAIWWIFWGLIIYAVLRILRSNFWSGWSKYGWIILIILYFNIFYSLVHGLPRYALPIYPFYVILATVGGGFLWQKILSKKPLLQE